MISLAVLTSDAPEPMHGNETRQQQTDMYRRKLVQCLIAGEYTKGGP